MGVNFLERQILRRGHQLHRISQPEYGTDAWMMHVSPQTQEVENGRVEFQVKATDHLQFVDDGRSVTCTVEMAHVHFWHWEVDHPFILVLYDAQKHRAFWIDIQAYIDDNKDRIGDKQTLAVRIPIKNNLTVRAIERFRELSLTHTKRLP